MESRLESSCPNALAPIAEAGHGGKVPRGCDEAGKGPASDAEGPSEGSAKGHEGFSLRAASDRPWQKPLRMCTRRRKALLGPWPAAGQTIREGSADLSKQRVPVLTEDAWRD
mmetsp:Transcript_12496/g.29777  ORF Transcript_12496/g.29777 Transcript_12496/m.29777 type:complete len:112 (-) Transcript_12496:12-347(-)